MGDKVYLGTNCDRISVKTFSVPPRETVLCSSTTFKIKSNNDNMYRTSSNDFVKIQGSTLFYSVLDTHYMHLL